MVGGVHINRISGVYMVLLSGRRHLRIGVVYVRFGRWGNGSGWNFAFHKPQTKVLEYSLDDLVILYKADDSHSSLTFGAC